MSNEPAIQNNIQKMIGKAWQEQSKALDLSSYAVGDALREIPEEIFTLTQLEELDLSNNDIKEVPERIRVLKKLKRLSLFDNPIVKVPDIPGLALNWTSYLQCRNTLSKQHVTGIRINIDDQQSSTLEQGEELQFSRELALLTNLRALQVGLSSISSDTFILPPTGYIRDLISDLSQFPDLESLTFFGLLLKDVPDGIRDLKNLKVLAIYTAGLREVPDWMGGLKHLQILGLGSNKLTALPSSLASLSELKEIFLGGNRFTEIPEVIFQMTNLRRIDIGGDWQGMHSDGIKQIPATILQLPNLEAIGVEWQPIEVPPPEVVKEGVGAIKNYWRQQQETGIDYLCEAKLIIIGESGAGKSTLAKKIKKPEYELEPQEPSTEGIDVIRWSFPSAVRIKRDGREEIHKADFKVSIWDFGGQEIYHSTHQFFLTRRSLYALVSDDRKEDTDFNYWLHAVELLSDRSPLLIVQNEKQDRQRDIDLGSLRARFPNLRETFRTNLATNRGLIELKQMIQQELEHLPHIGTPLPKTWGAVRTALENDPRNHISLDGYFTICQENGFTRREEKLQLSSYLHDLGICLHFQDDVVLKNTVILKPKWGTDAVYKVLDDRTVLNNRGQFGPNDLARIWSDEKYSTMRDELLRLMMRFQLCYQLPNVETYIAPQMLSPTRPTYEWENRDGLVLRYEYDFLPKGILTRFIVALNHLIADHSLVWKSGVILARECSRAEIVEDYTRRKITVRVNGADSRSLLAIVDDQLERIHASFSGLKYDKFLPCNCAVCQTRDEPFAYPLIELKDFASQGDEIQCRVSRKLVNAANLIRDVFPAAVYAREKLLNQSGIFHQETGPTPEPSIIKEVFVSYAWDDGSNAIVDKIQEAFSGRDIVLVRDKSEMQYKDSIREFMERIGRGKCIVVVLSKKYLESKSCMFELTEIADRGDLCDRVFPIVLDDARVYDAIDRISYISHWEQKKEELNTKMKGVSGEYLQSIYEELEFFTKIRLTIDKIVNILGDMNALTPDQHQNSNFDSLLQALETRMAE